MLETVAKGFRMAKAKLMAGTLSGPAIDEAVRDIRMSLLEADVDLDVAKTFIDRVKARAREEIVDKVAEVELDGKVQEITPYHRFVAICQEELESLMGGAEAELSLAPRGVTAVMMVGLQGAGKTTSAAKLARWLAERQGKKVMMVAADVQRPAAIDQLETLGARIAVPVFAERGADPLAVCGAALEKAGRTGREVVIFDTAGRLAVDEVLMDELRRIRERTKPQEILLVVDAMIGQDAVRTARAFDEALGITGVIMTKVDGDARGGAALSIKEITGKPIKFVGMGEDVESLEVFRPEGFASRILGMGDVVGLVKEFERHVDQDKAEEDAERMFRGQFDMGDFVEQIGIIRKMGSLKELFDKMPMFQEGMPEGFRPDEREFTKIIAVHDSMTPLERRRPALIRDEKRLLRVASGSGRSREQVLDVLSKFDTMRRMMISLGDQPSLITKLPGFNQLAQVRKLRGLDLADLFGDAFELPQEPDEEDEGFESDDDLRSNTQPERREYFQNLSKPKGAQNVDRQKDKNRKKKKLANQARKRNRR
ncbi:MAG: signal recognition particle protein [Deltaproteobacteria bacterium]|nr:signal recognition particle protein [Deltaproteobacteria bacterium]